MNWRPVLLAVVLIALGVAIYFSVIRGSSSLPDDYEYEEREAGTDTVTSAGGTEQAPAAKVEQVEKELEQEKVFVYDSTKLRNPMLPYLRKPKKEAVPVLIPDKKPAAKPPVHHEMSGIMWSPANPLVIIDGKVMGVGEVLRDGSIVTDIGKEYVALKRSGKSVRLTLQ